MKSGAWGVKALPTSEIEQKQMNKNKANNEQRTANSEQRTTNSEQRTANSEQRTASSE
jgi:hypothetical protein